MKKLARSIVLSSVLAALPVASAAPLAVSPLFQEWSADSITIAHGDKALSTGLDLIERGQGDRLSLMGAIRDLQDQIAAMPDAAALRARFASILGDLHDRAQAAYIHEHEIAMLRREIVDARIDRALAALQQRAEAAGWSSEEVRTVAMAWLARADVFVDAPDPEAYRARVMATIEVAMKRAAGVLDDVRELRIELLRLRIQAATSRLDAAVASGEMSELEYAELLAANIRRVRAIYMSELTR